MSEKKLSRPEPAVNGTDYQFNSDTHELKGADPEAFRSAHAKADEAQLAAALKAKEVCPTVPRTSHAGRQAVSKPVIETDEGAC